MAKQTSKSPYTTAERRGMILLLAILCVLGVMTALRNSGHVFTRPAEPSYTPERIEAAPTSPAPSQKTPKKKKAKKGARKKVPAPDPTRRSPLDEPVSPR